MIGITVVTLVFTSVILGIIWLKKNYNYWKTRGLLTTPYSLLWGHMKDVALRKEVFIIYLAKMYQEMKNKGQKHFGFYMFHRPIYVPVDNDLVKSIIQTDFQHFHDRGMYLNEKKDPLNAHIFTLEGQRWKDLRVKSSPAFSPGKLKMMFDTILTSAQELDKVLENSQGSPLDMKDICGRFTMDTLGSCTFGIDINSLQNPKSEFVRNAKRVLNNNLRLILLFMLPSVAKFFNLSVNDPDITSFFKKVIKDTINYREKHNIFRRDFLHFFIQMKNRGRMTEDEKLTSNTRNDREVLTFDQIAAQTYLYLIAGYETSSNTLAFCLLELAQNQEIQTKARDEIREILAKYNDEITYEAIGEMKYLERCLNEGLRKYPPIATLNRVCTKEYKVPGTDLVIEKGTSVAVPVYAIQHDPEYYPEPEVFDPDRFLPDNINSRPSFSFIPFGEGPRYCLGARFGSLQIMVALVIILRNYEMTVNEMTYPIKFSKDSFSLITDRGILLDYKKI